jgi:hypothetical protein
MSLESSEFGLTCRSRSTLCVTLGRRACEADQPHSYRTMDGARVLALMSYPAVLQFDVQMPHSSLP